MTRDLTLIKVIATLFLILVCMPVGAGAGELSGLDVYVVGSYAYVAAGAGRLHVIDVRRSAYPIQVAEVDTRGEAKGVYVLSSHAYVADGSAGLQVVDVRDPASPRIVGSVETPGDARHVYVFGDYACVADGPAGLQIIALRDPARPRPVTSIGTPGEAQRVYVAGDYAYVAAGIGGGFRLLTSGNRPDPELWHPSVRRVMRARCMSYPIMPIWRMAPSASMPSISAIQPDRRLPDS